MRKPLVLGRPSWIGLALALLVASAVWAGAPAEQGEGVEEVRGANVGPGTSPPAQRELPQVEVFLTDWCPYCQKLEAFLKQNGVPYVRKNIEKDARYEREHEALGGGGIPLTRIGGERIVRGFQPDLIAQELGLEPAD